MKTKKLLTEIALVLSINNLLHSFFNLLIGFLAGALVGNLFGALWQGASIGSVLSLLVSTKRFHADWELFHKKHPLLVDEYLAVKETLHQQDEIVLHLRKDFEKRLKKISNAEFLTVGDFYKKIAIILLLVFFFIASPLFHIQLPHLRMSMALPNIDLPLFQSSNQKEHHQKSTDVAHLQGRQDRLTIHYSYQADLTDTQDPEEEQFLHEKTNQISISADDIYVDTLTKEEEALIKRYFSSVR